MAPELVAGGGYGGLIREKPHCAWVYFEASWRGKHDGSKIIKLRSILNEIFDKN